MSMSMNFSSSCSTPCPLPKLDLSKQMETIYQEWAGKPQLLHPEKLRPGESQDTAWLFGIHRQRDILLRWVDDYGCDLYLKMPLIRNVAPQRLVKYHNLIRHIRSGSVHESCVFDDAASAALAKDLKYLSKEYECIGRKRVEYVEGQFDE